MFAQITSNRFTFNHSTLENKRSISDCTGKPYKTYPKSMKSSGELTLYPNEPASGKLKIIAESTVESNETDINGDDTDQDFTGRFEFTSTELESIVKICIEETLVNINSILSYIDPADIGEIKQIKDASKHLAKAVRSLAELAPSDN
ncbi:MAG: hypothetical protein JKY95_07355 [Planctomycetaceae bacterium]|nr:hypothetical protein [Planctomycetaceae bacterium]